MRLNCQDRSTDFPFDTHRQNLQNVLRIQPRFAVPGSAGFRFVDELKWLNRFLFPVSPHRFVSDLQQLEPGPVDVHHEPGRLSALSGRPRGCQTPLL